MKIANQGGITGFSSQKVGVILKALSRQDQFYSIQEISVTFHYVPKFHMRLTLVDVLNRLLAQYKEVNMQYRYTGGCFQYEEYFRALPKH